MDAYNAEFNRDIEPMRAGSSDNLYHQMIANIRRFEGARLVPLASAPRSMGIDGDFAGWKAVLPEFHAAIGNTAHRDHAGWGDLKYVDNSGRNDIVAAQSRARCQKRLFLRPHRRCPVAFKRQKLMRLFINVDGNASTGWNGYDFLINGAVLNERETTIAKWDGGWNRIARARFKAHQKSVSISNGSITPISMT